MKEPDQRRTTAEQFRALIQGCRRHLRSPQAAPLPIELQGSSAKKLTAWSMTALACCGSCRVGRQANMRPLALMDNGSTVLMVGASDERGGYEMADQLQVWRLQGKKLGRTPSWIPYPDDKEDWGKRMNAAVVAAYPIDDRLMVTLSDKGHVVVWDMLG